MINNNLEANLKEYCITRSSDLFERELYSYFRYLAAFICKRKKITKDIDILINEMIAEVSFKLPATYNKDKGTAKCRVYIIMNDYILKQYKFNSQSKRDYKKVIYIEDMENQDEIHTHILEIEVDIFQYYKATLLGKTDILDKLETKLQKAIYKQVIKCLTELPDNDNYVDIITKRCKCSFKTVYNCLGLVRNILREDGLLLS